MSSVGLVVSRLMPTVRRSWGGVEAAHVALLKEAVLSLRRRQCCRSALIEIDQKAALVY